MNLVGKIFIVLIFVMSLLWMGFSVAVYATHTQWRDYVENAEATADKPLGLKPQLEQQKERNQELNNQLTKAGQELAAEKSAKRQAQAKLETENAELRRRLDEQAQRNATLVQSVNEAVATLKATQDSEAALRLEIAGGPAPDGTQVVGLREEIRQAQKARDDAFDQVVKLTDQYHQLFNEHTALKAKMAQLAADLANAKAVLDKFGLPADPARVQDTPPIVDGVVLDAGANGMIEISLGSDDGLRKGHRLEVVRQAGGVSTYLGRIEVMETAPDKSVCKVLPQFLQGPIQRNDRVTSKLQPQ